MLVITLNRAVHVLSLPAVVLHSGQAEVTRLPGLAAMPTQRLYPNDFDATRDFLVYAFAWYDIKCL